MVVLHRGWIIIPCLVSLLVAEARASDTQLAKSLSQAFRSAAERALPSVVTIYSRQSQAMTRFMILWVRDSSSAQTVGF